jgi:hypothetical protein
VRCGRDRDLDPAPALARPDPADTAWFAKSGFDEIAFEALETSVGVNRLCDAPGDTLPSHRFFTFRAA